AMRVVAPRLRAWDVRTARRVTSFVAISEFTRERIKRCYGRASTVIYPPVDVQRFQPDAQREDFYLLVSALVPYKRVDLALAAFAQLERRLVIVGAGPERERLEARATSNVQFLGWRSDNDVASLMSRCRAFIFPGTEDFGITPVEAQAAGAPVIAHASGGALESVVDGTTGVYFTEQSAAALRAAVLRSETMTFSAATLTRNAQRFDTS